MAHGYFEKLQQEVLVSSVSGVWSSAVLEWTVTDLEEDPAGQGECICGHPNLVQMFTIKNAINGAVLYPIGNVCVNKFGREDLNREVNLFSELQTLRKAIHSGPVTMTSKYFSRALLDHLYERGVFTPDQYNNGNGKDDYIFLLKMFNKRNKDAITAPQRWKINAILRSKIVPFVLSGA